MQIDKIGIDRYVDTRQIGSQIDMQNVDTLDRQIR